MAEGEKKQKMQTFITHTDFTTSCQLLDQARLGKQRVEAQQILDILEGRSENSRWKNHPAVRMWKGYENALKYYINTVLITWIRRGCENNVKAHRIETPVIMPPWLSDLRLVYSHQANLIRKYPGYYKQLWPDVNDTTPYWWPVPLMDKKKQQALEEFWGRRECCLAVVNDNKTILILREVNNGESN
jgi:hypothetical protein